MDIREIGRRIVAMRKERGWSQEQLAEKLDCSTKHISSSERGKSLMSLEKLIDLCYLFDCSLDYLVFGYEKENSISLLPNFVLDILENKNERERQIFLSYVKQYRNLRGDMWEKSEK